MSMMEYYETAAQQAEAAQAEKMKSDAMAAAREYITGKLPRTELLAQLAEEGAELTHAALKLRRALDGTNPTPVGQYEALGALMEEIADVTLLVQLLYKGTEELYVRQTMEKKLLRWRDRLVASMTDGKEQTNG